MFLDASVGTCLVLYLGVCVPAMHSVERGGPEDAKDRWLSYWVCLILFVGPAMVLLPWWVPFRYEWMLLCISVLRYEYGLGAHNVLHGLLIPRIRPYLLFLHQGRAMLVSDLRSLPPPATRRDDDASSTSSTVDMKTVGPSEDGGNESNLVE